MADQTTPETPVTPDIRENDTPRPSARQRHARNMRRHDMFLLRGFTLLLLVFCLLNLFHKDKDFSDNENRTLATFPKLTISSLADGSFFSGLESACSDQFIGRDRWISVKIGIDRLLGRRESNGVYIGKSNYLLQIPETPDEENLNKTLTAMADFANRHKELSITTLIAPNAVSVMSSKLPANAPVRSQAEDLVRISEAMPEHVNTLNVLPSLAEHAGEELYYRTDHHWTSLGAWYAFKNAAPALDVAAVADYKQYTVCSDFEGTLASKSGIHNTTDLVKVFVPENTGIHYYVLYEDTQEKTCSMYDATALDKKDKYTVFFGGNHPLVDIKTTANNDRVLLLFKDSYANCFVQFLTPYFQEIVMVDPRYYYDDVESLMNHRKVTDVLFLYNLDTFMNDTSLADTLNVADTADPGSLPALEDTLQEDDGTIFPTGGKTTGSGTGSTSEIPGADDAANTQDNTAGAGNTTDGTESSITRETTDQESAATTSPDNTPATGTTAPEDTKQENQPVFQNQIGAE